MTLGGVGLRAGPQVRSDFTNHGRRLPVLGAIRYPGWCIFIAGMGGGVCGTAGVAMQRQQARRSCGCRTLRQAGRQPGHVADRLVFDG